MDQRNRGGALRREDWRQVYAEVPEAVNEGVQLALLRIRARERRRRRILRGCAACAACLALLLVGALALPGLSARQDAPDRIAQPMAVKNLLSLDAAVYASKSDPHFHVHTKCPNMEAGAVELPLVTALEFEKTACPVCGANVEIEGAEG